MKRSYSIYCIFSKSRKCFFFIHLKEKDTSKPIKLVSHPTFYLRISSFFFRLRRPRCFFSRFLFFFLRVSSQSPRIMSNLAFQNHVLVLLLVISIRNGLSVSEIDSIERFSVKFELFLFTPNKRNCIILTNWGDNGTWLLYTGGASMPRVNWRARYW